MIEIPSREDWAILEERTSSLATAHNKMVELLKENTECVGKLQDELQEMPGGYRNSQDIKNLKGRIERLEDGLLRLNERFNAYGTDAFVKELGGRVLELERLLESGKNVTVHSRLNDMEICITEHGRQIISQNQSHNEIHRNIEKLELCCKNVVASGKALEERIDRVDKNMNILSNEVSVAIKRTQRADKFMDKLRNL